MTGKQAGSKEKKDKMGGRAAVSPEKTSVDISAPQPVAHPHSFKSRQFQGLLLSLRAFVDNHRDGLSTLLVLGGLGVMAFPLLTEAYGAVSQQRLKRQWEERAEQQKVISAQLEKDQRKVYGERKFEAEESILRRTLENKPSPAKRAPFPSTRIVVSKIGLDQVILEGTGDEVLKNGPGHYSETVNPGAKGNVGIAGHRVTYTHPFNRLDELVPGDSIVLETLDAIFEYKVESSKVTDPSDTTNLKPSEDYRLTLTTCTPKYSAQARLNVIAELQKTTERKTGNVFELVKGIFIAEPEKKPVVIVGDDIPEILAKAKAALVRNPEDAKAHIKAADAYFKIGGYIDGVVHLNAAAKIVPDRPSIRKLLRQIDAREAELRREIRELQEKGRSIPPSVHLELGDLLFAKESYAEAATAYEQASVALPNSADILYYIALCKEKMGQREEAVALLRSALEFIPDYREARDALTRLTGYSQTIK